MSSFVYVFYILLSILHGCSTPSQNRILGTMTPFTGNAVEILWTKLWEHTEKVERSFFSLSFSPFCDYVVQQLASISLAWREKRITFKLLCKRTPPTLWMMQKTISKRGSLWNRAPCICPVWFIRNETK